MRRSFLPMPRGDNERKRAARLLSTIRSAGRSADSSLDGEGQHVCSAEMARRLSLSSLVLHDGGSKYAAYLRWTDAYNNDISVDDGGCCYPDEDSKRSGGDPRISLRCGSPAVSSSSFSFSSPFSSSSSCSSTYSLPIPPANLPLSSSAPPRDQFQSVIVLEGYIVMRRGLKWKRFWCSLRADERRPLSCERSYSSSGPSSPNNGSVNAPRACLWLFKDRHSPVPTSTITLDFALLENIVASPTSNSTTATTSTTPTTTRAAPTPSTTTAPTTITSATALSPSAAPAASAPAAPICDKCSASASPTFQLCVYSPTRFHVFCGLSDVDTHVWYDAIRCHSLEARFTKDEIEKKVDAHIKLRPILAAQFQLEQERLRSTVSRLEMTSFLLLDKGAHGANNGYNIGGADGVSCSAGHAEITRGRGSRSIRPSSTDDAAAYVRVSPTPPSSSSSSPSPQKRSALDQTTSSPSSSSKVARRRRKEQRMEGCLKLLCDERFNNVIPADTCCCYRESLASHDDLYIAVSPHVDDNLNTAGAVNTVLSTSLSSLSLSPPLSSSSSSSSLSPSPSSSSPTRTALEVEPDRDHITSRSISPPDIVPESCSCCCHSNGATFAKANTPESESWKRLYVIITGGFVYFYTLDDSVQLHVVISIRHILSISTVVDDAPEAHHHKSRAHHHKSRCRFVLETPLGTFVLGALHEVAVNEWIDAIERENAAISSSALTPGCGVAFARSVPPFTRVVPPPVTRAPATTATATPTTARTTALPLSAATPLQSAPSASSSPHPSSPLPGVTNCSRCGSNVLPQSDEHRLPVLSHLCCSSVATSARPTSHTCCDSSLSSAAPFHQHYHLHHHHHHQMLTDTTHVGPPSDSYGMPLGVGSSLDSDFLPSFLHKTTQSRSGHLHHHHHHHHHHHPHYVPDPSLGVPVEVLERGRMVASGGASYEDISLDEEEEEEENLEDEVEEVDALGMFFTNEMRPCSSPMSISPERSLSPSSSPSSLALLSPSSSPSVGRRSAAYPATKVYHPTSTAFPPYCPLPSIEDCVFLPPFNDGDSVIVSDNLDITLTLYYSKKVVENNEQQQQEESAAMASAPPTHPIEPTAPETTVDLANTTRVSSDVVLQTADVLPSSNVATSDGSPHSLGGQKKRTRTKKLKKQRKADEQKDKQRKQKKIGLTSKMMKVRRRKETLPADGDAPCITGADEQPPKKTVRMAQAKHHLYGDTPTGVVGSLDRDRHDPLNGAFTSSRDEPETYVLKGNVTTIGRSQNNDLKLLDTKISRNHAKVETVVGQPPFLLDLGSSRGTKVNGVTYVKRALRIGDSIKLGSTVLVVGVRERGHRPSADAASPEPGTRNHNHRLRSHSSSPASTSPPPSRVLSPPASSSSHHRPADDKEFEGRPRQNGHHHHHHQSHHEDYQHNRAIASRRHSEGTAVPLCSGHRRHHRPQGRRSEHPHHHHHHHHSVSRPLQPLHFYQQHQSSCEGSPP